MNTCVVVVVVGVGRVVVVGLVVVVDDVEGRVVVVFSGRVVVEAEPLLSSSLSSS